MKIYAPQISTYNKIVDLSVALWIAQLGTSFVFIKFYVK